MGLLVCTRRAVKIDDHRKKRGVMDKREWWRGCSCALEREVARMRNSCHGLALERCVEKKTFLLTKTKMRMLT